MTTIQGDNNDISYFLEKNKDNLKLLKEEEKEIIDDEGNKKIIITKIYIKDTTYTESSKKSQLKYKEKNLDKIKEYKKNYNKERYANDVEYREKLKQRVKENKLKKKMESEKNKE